MIPKKEKITLGKIVGEISKVRPFIDGTYLITLKEWQRIDDEEIFNISKDEITLRLLGTENLQINNKIEVECNFNKIMNSTGKEFIVIEEAGLTRFKRIENE